MTNLRNVNNDILHNWLIFRDDKICTLSNNEKQNHEINFDEIYNSILEKIADENKEYVKKQLKLLETEFINYSAYWNEKYYRNGFCDGISLIIGATK